MARVPIYVTAHQFVADNWCSKHWKHNKVNQELGENENAEATAKATLQDENAFLSAIQTQEQDTTAMYEQRVADRAEEKKAVSGAIAVLSAENPSLLQRGSKARR